MRKYLITIFILIFLPGIVCAEDFLSISILPDSQTVSKEDGRLEFKTGLSHDEVVTFYREELKTLSDIKYREWTDATYIEDDSNRPWHSITISKGDEKETTVVIAKDSWTWIIGTLILRYIGVFAVLLILYVGMKISGMIIDSFVKKAAAK